MHGSGGITPYFKLDGSATKTVFSKSTRHEDNVVQFYGTGDDLQIYHDGSNSYINETGTGVLSIQSDGNRSTNK